MVVTKPAELRKEQKKYFNIAYQGEPVVVSRPRNENLVIMSEEQYNDIMTKNRMLSYYCSLTNKTIDNDNLISDNSSDISELKDSNGVIVGIANGIELCRPGYDFDAYDEEIAKMFGVM